jgi:YD repeat-containing protein
MQKLHVYGVSAIALACSALFPAHAVERGWAYTYTAQGLVETVDGPRTDVQDITRYAYDDKGNLIKVTNALGQITQLGSYDERGNPGTLTDANGVVSTLTYSGVDPRLATITTDGSTTSFAYDAVGQLTQVTCADGSWLKYTYDSFSPSHALRSGKRAAALMTLIQSARLNGHDPYAYLKDVLTRQPTQPVSTLAGLLPYCWEPGGA